MSNGTRFYTSDIELRAADSETMEVEGYALKFDRETQIGSDSWGFMESISRDAMKTADLSNVVLNFNHSMDTVLARTTNGSLELRVDETGLLIKAKIIDTTSGKDIFKMIQEGLINRMSFAVQVKKSEWLISETDDSLDKRIIKEFGRFYDVSAVTFPAYEDTLIQARSKDINVQEHFKEREYNRQIKRLDSVIERMN